MWLCLGRGILACIGKERRRREKAEDYSPEEKEEEEVFREEMQSAAVQGRAGITLQKKIPLLLLLRGHFLH